MNETSSPTEWKGPLLPSGPEDYYIEASRSLVERPLRTLKHDDLFAVFDIQGDLNVHDQGAEGLYFKDTRFLSRLLLRIGGAAPLLLGSVVLDDNGALIVDMTNADLHDANGKLWQPRDTIFINRLKFVCANTCYERVLLRRYDPVAQPLPVELGFDADFADLFEIRGETRERRGVAKAEILDARTLRYTYCGLDKIERSTTLYFDPAPVHLTPSYAAWEVDLQARDRQGIVIKTACSVGRKVIPEPPAHIPAFRTQRRTSRRRMAGLGGITSSNDLFNEILDRSASDIDMLLTATDYGLYPYAGVPWYSTVFGRDGILTAMQLLWIAPEVAGGVLRALALTQATETDEAADAEPGKIIHEMRDGEMARLGEVPFRRYYGSVDATPLFVWLAGEYLRRSGDIETARKIWPNVEAALGWIDSHADSEGFLAYSRMTERGLANQGWKDSYDSIFHADGRLAEGPIALCEVQAYVFAARKAAAFMADIFGDAERAAVLDAQAEDLRQRFEDRFWLEDLGTYALALDGRNEPCRVRSSNAGHALYAGIAAPERAQRIATQLVGRDFFSGWGIRTIPLGEPRYNPMAYHNGSIWPHDNALIALGLARYGHKAEVAKIFQALIEAAVYFEFRRLPELFCGFTRRRRRGPTPYPVACSPQAWAAATPFALIAASAGLELDHAKGYVSLRNPVLPPAVSELVLPELRVAGSRLQLHLGQSGDDVTTTVTRRDGPAGLVILK